MNGAFDPDELQNLLQQSYSSDQQRHDTLMVYGEHLLGMLPLDVLELKTPAGTPAGLALVLPYSLHPGSRTLQVEGPLPEWNFLAHFLVTDPENLSADQVERQLLQYLLHLGQQDPEQFHELLQLHDAGLKTLALENETLYRLLVHHFVFETTQGNLTLNEYLKHTGYLRFIPHADQYHQVARIAAAQGHFIINASYSRDAELLTAYARLYPDSSVELMDAVGYAQHLARIEHPSLQEWLNHATDLLQDLNVHVDVRSFQPDTVPALLVASEAYKHHRHFQTTQSHHSPAWKEVIEHLLEQDHAPEARLFLNLDSPAIQHLLQVQDLRVLQETLRVVYLQALLLGKHPVGDTELLWLSEHLDLLMDWGMQASRFRNLN